MNQPDKPHSRERTALAITDSRYQITLIIAGVIGYFSFGSLALRYALVEKWAVALWFGLGTQIALIVATMTLTFRVVLNNEDFLSYLKGEKTDDREA
jgi:hypothetical protein